VQIQCSNNNQANIFQVETKEQWADNILCNTITIEEVTTTKEEVEEVEEEEVFKIGEVICKEVLSNSHPNTSNTNSNHLRVIICHLNSNNLWLVGPSLQRILHNKMRNRDPLVCSSQPSHCHNMIMSCSFKSRSHKKRNNSLEI